MTTPTPPPGSQPPGPAGSSSSPNLPLPESGIKAEPMTFLGMYFNQQQAEQLWQIIIQNLQNQISHERDLMVQALQKLNPDYDQDS